MQTDPIPHWQPEFFNDHGVGIRQALERIQLTVTTLEAAWTEFNKSQRVGVLGPGADRDKLSVLTNDLAEELPFLEKQLDSDSLGNTDDYLLVLRARQQLDYSRERLGMV